MLKAITGTICMVSLLACSTNKKVEAKREMPLCLETKIKDMAADPHEGSPISVSRFTYQQHTVYYMVSPCCDKYNVVYDSVCNVLGYPDGGFTGRGDGNMPDFRKEAASEKVIWQINKN